MVRAVRRLPGAHTNSGNATPDAYVQSTNSAQVLHQFAFAKNMRLCSLTQPSNTGKTQLNLSVAIVRYLFHWSCHAEPRAHFIHVILCMLPPPERVCYFVPCVHLLPFIQDGAPTCQSRHKPPRCALYTKAGEGGTWVTVGIRPLLSDTTGILGGLCRKAFICSRSACRISLDRSALEKITSDGNSNTPDAQIKGIPKNPNYCIELHPKPQKCVSCMYPILQKCVPHVSHSLLCSCSPGWFVPSPWRLFPRRESAIIFEESVLI